MIARPLPLPGRDLDREREIKQVLREVDEADSELKKACESILEESPDGARRDPSS
jgi:hypothetical protein